MPEGDRGRDAAVADSTTLIFLAKIERLDDLWRRFDRVLVPAPIHQEVVREGMRLEHTDAIRVEAAIDQGDLVLAEQTPIPEALEDVGLEYGDRAVLALALDRGIGTVLTDDGGVRAVARTQGLTPRGTLAFLVQALDEGKLPFEAYLGELEALTQTGLRLGAELYAGAVRRGREIADGS